MDGQDDPQTLKVYRLVKEGRADESGFGGVQTLVEDGGVPPRAGEAGGLLGAAVPELRQSHKAMGAGTGQLPERKTMTTSS